MKIIGHRGAKGLAPENTLASFEKALEHGVDEIECDVRATADGVIILEHNSRMRDEAGQTYVVRRHRYADLLKYKPNLITLEQAIAYIDRRVPLMIEVKPNVPVEPIIKHIKAMHRQGWQLADLTLASEDYQILKTARQLMPELDLTIVESWSGVRATWKARRLGIKRLSMNYRSLWSGFAVPIIHRGYTISAYTVNNQVAARRLMKYGVQSIFTDVPDIFDVKERQHES